MAAQNQPQQPATILHSANVQIECSTISKQKEDTGSLSQTKTQPQSHSAKDKPPSKQSKEEIKNQSDSLDKGPKSINTDKSKEVPQVTMQKQVGQNKPEEDQTYEKVFTVMGCYNGQVTKQTMISEEHPIKNFDSMAHIGAQMGAISAQLSSWTPINQVQNKNDSSDRIKGTLMCGIKTFGEDEDPREFIQQIFANAKSPFFGGGGGWTQTQENQDFYKNQDQDQQTQTQQTAQTKDSLLDTEKIKEQALRQAMRSKVSKEEKEKEKEAALH